MHRLGRTAIPLILVLSLALTLGVLGYRRISGGIRGPQEVATILLADHESAYQLVEAGDVWGSATTLVYSLRKVPGDDPLYVDDALVDAGVAETRFAVYIMAELMDDAMRKEFMETVLAPQTYPTDELVQLQYEVTHAPTLERTYEIIDRFWALANGTHPSVRVASLAILAAPYSFELWPHRAIAREILVKQYPGLDITRTVLRWSFDACRTKNDRMLEAMAKVVNKELTTPEEQQILYTDPVCSRTIAALPSLIEASSRQDGVVYLCGGITDESDWKTRFACINQAVGFADMGCREQVETALETLATSGLDTPDTVRAKCLLLGYAQDDGDIEIARRWGDDLVKLRRVTDVVDRTLHEEVGNAIQFYADFLDKNGLKTEAAVVYESLIVKFPNSALAAKCEERVASME